ncbi:MAG TPA: FkbM family methyltransferase, partial [Gammaproteobacteria bacterium]|nr:FkbM family methyltransferase [Gammaproteobacteria bacterium]
QDHELRMRLADELFLHGNFVAAIPEYQRVAEQKSDYAPAWKRLAETAARVGRRTDAIVWYRRALEVDSRQPDVLNDLGILLSGNGEYEEATRVFEQAVRIQPEFSLGFDNLGGARHLQGRYDGAVDAYKKALDIDPMNAVTLSNLIAITNYRRQDETGVAAGLHARYRRSLSPERIRAVAEHGNDPAPGRRLRVGYVSPDFRLHSVAFFIEPLIQGHDRRLFEVFCYSDVADPDRVTERLSEFADQWRDVSSDSHESLSRRIREDQIDLLVDLAGHFAGNRLPVFAQKPAPVQLAYLGYPATTGLPEVDYRLTDAVADPPGGADGEYSETLIRLPDAFLCYRPPRTAPPVALMNQDDRTLTFGSFNELPKLSPELIQSWCRILEELPGSRLLLKATALVDPATRARVERRFEAAGISPDRIELLGRTETLEQHLGLYARVDVALDTFPYNGTTTTCEALYMGIPVVTLPGNAHSSRVGASLLEVLNLPELVAPSEDAYVATAVALAVNREQRRVYAETLRERMLASPLCDERSFVQAVEANFLRCWDRWRGARRQTHERRSSPLEVTGAIDIRTRDGGRMVLPDDLDQLTTYVLLEQEDWFEDETSFLRKFLAPGMRVLDVGANFGVYTLLAARGVGAHGRIFSVEPSSTTARWLRANVALNDFENVDVFEHALSDRNGELRLSMQAGAEGRRLLADASSFERGERVKVLRLDEFARRCGIESIDFVKLDAEGAEKQIIDGGRSFFARESPLIMFEIKSTQDFDYSLVGKFSDLGYRPLRLIPGLELLAPVDSAQPLDSYVLNLFACRDNRWEDLLQRGLLAVKGGDQTGAREASEDEVWGYLSSGRYSRSRADAWRTRPASKRNRSDVRWMRMLAYFTAAADVASDPWSRLASLEAAFELAADAGAEIEPAARLHSLARIAWALGRRSQAVDALGALLDLGDDGARAFDRPFLPASPGFDAIDPGDRVAAWCEACAHDQFERLRSFSSYFLGRENLASLQRLRSNAFQRPEMERRRLLVQLRHGLPLSGASHAVGVRSEENHNPDFWSRRLERG